MRVVAGAVWLLTAMLAAVPAREARAGNPPPDTTPDLTGLSLEQLMEVELVYAAARREQPASDAASSVTVVSAAEIRRHGYRTLADVLRSVASFHVTNDRNYSYVGVRGVGLPGDYNTRILLLVDGLRTNDNVYDASMFAREFILDVDLIERVEVVRGPGAALFGNSAFFAVVNVVTRKGRELQGFELAAAGGSFETWQGRAAYGRKLPSGVEFLASVSGLRTPGQDLYYPEFDTPASNHGRALGVDDEAATNLAGTLSWRDFTFRSARLFRRKTIPTASYGAVFGDPNNWTRDTLTLLSLEYQGRPVGGLDVSARGFHGRYDYRGRLVYVSNPGVLNEDFGRGRWAGLEWNAAKRLGRHRVSVGGELQQNGRQDQDNHDLEPFVSYGDVRARSNRWAVYAQAEIEAAPWIQLHLGARHDHYSAWGRHTSPRLGVILRPASGTRVKLLAATAFRAPNEYELHYYLDQPLLEPETLAALEAVVEHSFGERLRVNASLFQNRASGLIALTGDPTALRFENGSRLVARGVELGLEAKSARGDHLRASYSHQRSEDHETRAEISNSPRHLAKASLEAPLWRGAAFTGLDAHYVSARRTLGGGVAPGFVVTNLSLSSTRLLKGAELVASVYNLFDARYADPSSEEHLQDVIPQDSRSFRLKLTWRF